MLASFWGGSGAPFWHHFVLNHVLFWHFFLRLFRAELERDGLVGLREAKRITTVGRLKLADRGLFKHGVRAHLFERASKVLDCVLA